jgi:hypothetical protein
MHNRMKRNVLFITEIMQLIKISAMFSQGTIMQNCLPKSF